MTIQHSLISFGVVWGVDTPCRVVNASKVLRIRKTKTKKNTKQTPFAEMLNFMYHNNSGTSTFRYAKKKPIL